jgi:hypothetical protein
MDHRDDPVTGVEPLDVLADGEDTPSRFAPELLGQRKAGTTGKRATEPAAPIMQVEPRDRGELDLH